MAKKTKPESSAVPRVRGVDLAEIERLLDFMKEHGLEEFEYEREGIHVYLKKAPDERPRAAPRAVSSDAGTAAAGGPPSGTTASASGSPLAQSALSGGKGRSEEADFHLIKSPVVGTFYAAASPGADPFVTVGSGVEPGQVLCVIEAMKLMNEIESDIAGEVVRIFVENGQPVEYGELLFGIRPQGKK
jgi:acetyl-CoA carboxylase biotin carboxyl carrier protein